MSKPDHDNDSLDKLSQAYDRMLGRFSELMGDTQKATGPIIEKAMEQAKQTAIELGELTREESQKVAAYVRRDLHDAAERMEEGRKEFGEWFRFDVRVIEDQLFELFAKAADQTSVQLRQMAEYAREVAVYKTGEVTGPGTLVCVECGKEMHFKKTGHIPPCPGCKHTEFKRPQE
ncbi:MAG: zinc ribbon-containing protein [Gammaproteobacteria bacterium]